MPPRVSGDMCLENFEENVNLIITYVLFVTLTADSL